ncbi:MAG TPA: acetyl-CoA carboxylase biotin carboxylase subunit [Nitrolancea sp.]|nr:acetyl-CoA carboxylase biotin carboxylase subunit [Nitrolancea sp.]
MGERVHAFQKVLVANRGEIALRVMRACRELGVATIAVYGAGELDAPHVRYADEAYRIPSDQPIPYLDIAALIEVARRANAEAVHPGYGFLAENAAFATACAEAGIVFIGPPAPAMRVMGDKVRARQAAIEAGVPVVPGSDGPIDVDGARAFGDANGYPIALKAAAGGGGRGFRVAWQASEVEGAYRGAAGEGARYFGDATVYAERYLDHPRHIEVQVFADTQGNVVSLGERDCSIQRRHQKLIEESPSPAIDQKLRHAMGRTAVALARSVDYLGAGTVEYLYQDGAFYFLEMNTRIQVEHPVTEMVTGIDLVKEQIQVAAGEPLSFEGDIEPRGHAIECRINAEDPFRAFAPSPGTVTTFRPPSGFGIRIDSGAGDGHKVLPEYDSLLAKLIVWGRDREEAIARLRRALAEFSVTGTATTIPFHRAVAGHPVFQCGNFDTRFLERHPDILQERPSTELATGTHLNGHQRTAEEYVVEVAGKRFDVRLYAPASKTPSREPAIGRARSGSAVRHQHGEVTSPIQGTVLTVAVQAGDTVAAGELICVIEAMKMENEITAPQAGIVKAVEVTPGQAVRIGARLAIIDAPK